MEAEAELSFIIKNQQMAERLHRVQCYRHVLTVSATCGYEEMLAHHCLRLKVRERDLSAGQLEDLPTCEAH